MLKELVQFTQSLKEQEMNNIGVVPKEGLHVVLTLKQEDNQVNWPPDGFISEVYSKKTAGLTPLLQECAAWAQAAWMVNTNKCFDLPAKGIHSCSPYCLAFKRESLKGGAKYADAKTKLPERINAYFTKAIDLLDDEGEKQRIEIFKYTLNSEEKLNAILSRIPEYESLKDANYIVFYLREPLEAYQKANTKYLADKLFNDTSKYPIIKAETSGEYLEFGVGSFFNGYNSKKPYLLHQTAAFDTQGRISSIDARLLFDFENILVRNILPKPLPIFIDIKEFSKDRDGLAQSSIALFKTSADEGIKIGYREIIETLYRKYENDLGNYYLLFYSIIKGEIIFNDFDFVPKFEYYLKDEADKPWQIVDLFSVNYQATIETVFDFQYSTLLYIFNNALVVKTKAGGFQYKFFEDLEVKYCKTDTNYLLIQKYRKAFYDFIYKSKRHAITQHIFNEIMLSNILEDIRMDRFENNKHTEDLNIRRKLNIWFSLYERFHGTKQHNKTMINETEELKNFIKKLADGQETIKSDQQFGFTFGQLIRFVNRLHESSDRSYSRVKNSYMTKRSIDEYKKVLAKDVGLYMFKIKDSKYNIKFDNLFSQLMLSKTNTSIDALMPYILGGMFASNILLTKEHAVSETPNNQDIIETEE